MAVIVTDLRTVPAGPSGNAQADAVTGWGTSGSITLYTSNPAPIELTGCIGVVVSTTTQDVYFNVSSRNMSDDLVYVWVLPRGEMDTLVNGGYAIFLGDGTDQIGYHLGGSDKAAFRHSDGFPSWECLVLDTSILPTTNFTARAGAEATLTLTAITEIGAMFKTLSKALGNIENCFIDIIRVGTGGLQITGGGVGTEGKFSEIAADDRSNADGKGYGIIRELGTDLFGLQGALQFGNSASTLSLDFEDKNVTVAFEDRFVDDDKWKISVVGNATGTTSFVLGTKVGTGDTALGAEGVIFTTPSTIAAAFDATDTDVETVKLYGCTFRNFTALMSFSADATNGPNHEVIGVTFDNCAQVVAGRVEMRANVFSGYTPTTEAALLWNANIDIKNSSFSNNTRGIEHDTAGEYTYDNLTFAGNTYDIVNSVEATVTDSYSETNQDSTLSLNGTNNAAGQEITGDGNVLSRARFYLKKVGTPAGNMVAKLYASDIGSPAAPTGSVLATSNVVSANSLTTGYVLTDFEFEDEFTLVNTTKYFIVIEYTTGTGTDYVDVGYDGSTPTHTGNAAVFTTSWTGQTYDLCFYVNTGGIVKINATNGSDPTTTVNDATIKGATIIVLSVTYTLTSIVSGSEVRIYVKGVDINDAGEELAGIESSGTSFAYPYNYPGSDTDIIVVVFKVDKKPVRFLDVLGNSNKSVQIFQIDAPNYSNP